MPKHIPALAGRAAIVASSAAAAAFLAVLPATPAAAAPAAVATVTAPAVATAPVQSIAVTQLAQVTPAPAIAPVPSAVTASALDIAMSKIGTPYRYGAAGPNAFDCSGLVQWSFKQAGMTLPRVAAAQAGVGTRIAKADLQRGDLVFFYAPISHVAIYIGDGKVVHASTAGQPVKISDLNRMPFATARRI